MKSRQLTMLSGVAVAAGQGLSQTRQSAGGASLKTLMKLSSPSYEIPKTGSKKAKHLDSLTLALSLTPDPQQQASAIFTNALATRAALGASLKTGPTDVPCDCEPEDKSPRPGRLPI